MALAIDAAVTWIRSEFGGRRHPPVIGLRPTIRFQRNVAAWQSVAWDVEVVSVAIDPETWRGTAKLAFSAGASPAMDNMKEGEPIELLDAYRVIAVGVILAVEQS